MKKPTQRISGPYWDYHDIIGYIEKKYDIDTRSYVPKDGFTERQIAEAKLEYGNLNKEPYLDFWHYIIDKNNIHNGCYFILNLFGDRNPQSTSEGDWEGDSDYRPRWVREIQKLIYDEFKPEGGEMRCWVSW